MAKIYNDLIKHINAMIPVYSPYFTKESLKYAHDAIDSTWISNQGKYLSLVIDELKEVIDSEYIILTNNGTSATHLLALALKYKHPNIKNLIVPSNVYIAAWNMFLNNPEYNFIPVDTNLDTWNTDIDELRKVYKDHKEDTAFLAVHNIGNIMPIHDIMDEFPEWVVVEDNCEGFLGSYGHYDAGTKSLASSVSFYGNKSITSGEGGMFCTNDKDLFNYINRAKSHFITKEKFIFDGLGYNYRMTNVQAAILYGQLELLDDIISKKQEIFDLYKSKLGLIKRIKFQHIELDTIHSNWMFGISINDSNRVEIEKLMLHLFQNDIDSRPMFPPINYHSHLSKFGDNFPNSVKLYNSIIMLPSHPDLTAGQVLYICGIIKDFF